MKEQIEDQEYRDEVFHELNEVAVNALTGVDQDLAVAMRLLSDLKDAATSEDTRNQVGHISWVIDEARGEVRQCRDVVQASVDVADGAVIHGG